MSGGIKYFDTPGRRAVKWVGEEIVCLFTLMVSFFEQLNTITSNQWRKHYAEYKKKGAPTSRG